MANVILGNKIYIDSTGEITQDRVRVAYILFTPSSANDSITIRGALTTSIAFAVQGSSAKNTMYFDFSNVPILFNDGIYVESLSSGATAIIITTTQGKN